MVTAHQLIWINTRDDIINALADAVISMRESNAYSDAQILAYVDDYITRQCDISFLSFEPLEDKFARIDMFGDIYTALNVGGG
jgi:hypothetical protein